MTVTLLYLHRRCLNSKCVHAVTQRLKFPRSIVESTLAMDENRPLNSFALSVLRTNSHGAQLQESPISRTFHVISKQDPYISAITVSLQIYLSFRMDRADNVEQFQRTKNCTSSKIFRIVALQISASEISGTVNPFFSQDTSSLLSALRNLPADRNKMDPFDKLPPGSSTDLLIGGS